jgi:uncharacterized membrane protein YkoI
MQSLAAQLGNGEAVSAAYVARRKAIEASHAANDDGSLTLALHCFGDGHEYDESADPVTDADSVNYLLAYGCVQRDIEYLERYDCRTIRQARRAVGRGEIPTWRGCGAVMENRVRQAVERVGR